jgi:hypothetical protein
MQLGETVGIAESCDLSKRRFLQGIARPCYTPEIQQNVKGRESTKDKQGHPKTPHVHTPRAWAASGGLLVGWGCSDVGG